MDYVTLELTALRAELAKANERNRVASDSIVSMGREIARLKRELALPRQCGHLDRTPPGTEICYLYKSRVYIMGIPEEDSEHSCDEMGCGSVGDHVLRIIDTRSTP